MNRHLTDRYLEAKRIALAAADMDVADAHCLMERECDGDVERDGVDPHGDAAGRNRTFA
jgi:hypothetical protein